MADDTEVEFASTLPPALQYAVSFPSLTITKRTLRAMGGWYLQYKATTKAEAEELITAERKIHITTPWSFPTHNIYSSDKKKVGEIVDRSTCLCFLCSKKVIVNVPVGQMIGYYKFKTRITSKVVEIYDENDDLLYVIKLGCCFGLVGTSNFTIFDSHQKEEIGCVICKTELFKPPIFTIELPQQSIPVKGKILILLSVFNLEKHFIGGRLRRLMI